MPVLDFEKGFAARDEPPLHGLEAVQNLLCRERFDPNVHGGVIFLVVGEIEFDQQWTLAMNNEAEELTGMPEVVYVETVKKSIIEIF
jgi:hypothetical protein